MIEMQREEDVWRIDDVVCGDPGEVVEKFYGWYLDYIRFDPETMQNPLVDGVYRDSPYLSADFIAEIDATLEEGIRYDPILCAQDVPESVTVGDVDQGYETASMVANISFEGHSFTVEVERMDGLWQITDVTCSID